eukprot:TRINITY_DN5796_c1_g1_i2.p1 TRINITY_DN5796_c1_g1~~TRINITY_DN5796_c1_g1_i2.p1  ORF type:complete len:177 (-),score=10.71 TRINITY_DN5796_c1_g1_i2:18-548(-)
MNDHDCGFFTVAYVEHIITHRHMNFNQKDMWYYRAKVVHDMYLQQMHAHRLFALLLEVVLDGPLYALTAGCLLLIFVWMSYTKFGKNFTKHVTDDDCRLFRLSTILISYWILERHNVGGVMKQFGLQQLVPPPFHMPFLRKEKMAKIFMGYTKILLNRPKAQSPSVVIPMLYLTLN